MPGMRTPTIVFPSKSRKLLIDKNKQQEITNQ